MIHIKVKDEKLRKRPEVRKLINKCEKILNDKLPEEKLIKMRLEFERGLETYGRGRIAYIR